MRSTIAVAEPLIGIGDLIRERAAGVGGTDQRRRLGGDRGKVLAAREHLADRGRRGGERRLECVRGHDEAGRNRQTERGHARQRRSLPAGQRDVGAALVVEEDEHWSLLDDRDGAHGGAGGAGPLDR
jgi:hypothetical protein